MIELSAWMPFVTITLIPITVWIVKIEKKLTRIETILEIKLNKKKERRKC